MSINRNQIAATGVIVVVLLAGAAGGVLIGANNWLPIGGKAQEADSGADNQAADDHANIVQLSKKAYRNLDIDLQQVTLSDYYRKLRIPAAVIERPGHSDHALVAPVTGIVSRVRAFPGQAVRVGEPLFDLQVNDEALTTAQVNLLDTVARLESVTAEVNRIGPLADMGTVVGRKKLQLEYERSELETKRNSRIQELSVRGLDHEQILRIVNDRQLVREMTVSMPGQLADENVNSTVQPQSSDPAARQPRTREAIGDGWDYTVERLHVFPGKAVRRGDDLCNLAYHTSLFIEGQAFENEVGRLTAHSKHGLPVLAEFGDHGKPLIRDNLKILYVDNHVDEDTQTFSFYVPFRNEIISDTTDEHGKIYRSWRFKPGQRAHVVVPVEKLENKVTLPLGAIAQLETETLVFRVVDKKKQAAHGHSHSNVFIEFEPVAVKILHQDSQSAAIATNGLLEAGDWVAETGAYQLHLALQVQSGKGGGGHAGHGHAHPHPHPH
jgi:hypothetical protein